MARAPTNTGEPTITSRPATRPSMPPPMVCRTAAAIGASSRGQASRKPAATGWLECRSSATTSGLAHSGPFHAVIRNRPSVRVPVLSR